MEETSSRSSFHNYDVHQCPSVDEKEEAVGSSEHDEMCSSTTLLCCLCLIPMNDIEKKEKHARDIR
eukprot:CAMPEP_0178983682 /NCGR_PEP_ID=MMETSP0795-20121207/1192_1 /TAXON_ID=88552 /ORGANISM="Amoebophrya sp., Strain Ameob2" /LENGTH=65 /DNA_ID=CAMNT_0020674475 /DNA_START=681 /DNA_END=875 /DNA_ORIENTATION=+